MSDERPYAGGGPMAHAEADAVCQQCGSVNPEGTLLCRNCGNNLREQRMRRVAEANYIPELPEDKTQRIEWVRRGLVTAAILGVVFLALYSGDIADWAVQKGANDIAATSDPWKGPDAPLFDMLQRRLEKAPVSADTPRAVDSKSGDYDGRFLIEEVAGVGAPFLGGAIARQEGTQVYFVALLDSGAEVRGVGEVDSAGNLRCPDAKVRKNGTAMGAFGYLQRAPDGGLSCTAQTDGNDATLKAALYRAQERTDQG